jgi:thiol-disulfide isomerase/thioredoxin
MKRSVIIIFLEVFTASMVLKATTANIETKPVIIAGQIIDATKQCEVKLRSLIFTEIVRGTTTQTDHFGYFKFEITIPFNIELFLFANETYSTLLLEPGDSIFLRIDKTKDPAITFHGDNEALNTEMYIIESFLNKKISSDDPMSHLNNDNFDDYFTYSSNKYKAGIGSFEKFCLGKGFKQDLIQFYHTKFTVKLGYDLVLYLYNQRFIKDNSIIEKTLPHYFTQSLDSIYKLTINSFSATDYHNFLYLYSHTLAFEINDSLTKALVSKDQILASRIQMDYIIKEFPDLQKDYLVALELNGLIDQGYINQDLFESYYNSISFPFYKNLLLKRYSLFKTIQASSFDSSKQKIFDLSLSDTVSLMDILKKNHPNRLVYVDIWATWCSPCIENFRYMPKLKEKFKDFDVDFVYLAVSSNKEAWLTVIKNYDLIGSHYFLSPKQNKELKTIIPYSLIPRYFIIGKNGKISIPDAKMPGEPDLINQLKELILIN